MDKQIEVKIKEILTSKTFKDIDQGLNINSIALNSIEKSIENINKSVNNNTKQIITNLDHLNSINESILNIQNAFEEHSEIIRANSNTDKFKEFLDIYHIYREQVKKEDTLENQRLSLFVASQSFLFFPYFSKVNNYQSNGWNYYDSFVLLGICGLGIFTSFLMRSSLQASFNASKAINEIWKNKFLDWCDNNMDKEIKYYKYISSSKSGSKQIMNFALCLLIKKKLYRLLLLFLQDYPKGVIRKLKKSHARGEVNLAFLKINNKIIPNIRHEVSEESISLDIDKWYHKIPMKFMWIWGVGSLFPIIVIILLCCNKLTANHKNIENLIISNNINFITEIENINDKEVQEAIREEQKKLNEKQEDLKKQEQDFIQREQDFIQEQQEFTQEQQKIIQDKKKLSQFLIEKSFTKEEITAEENNIVEILKKLSKKEIEEMIKIIEESENLSELKKKI